MKSEFDQRIDRAAFHARKWDPTILKAQFGHSDILPLWIADMDFSCPPAVVAAVKKVACHGLYGYTFVPDEYYDAVQSWCETRHGWKVSKNWITLTHGTVSTLHYIVQEFTEPGDGVIVQTPGYGPFESAVLRHGAKLLHNPLRLTASGYALDFDDLAVKAKEAKLLIFCSPHNPTGRVWTKEEVRRVAEICRDNGVLLVVDEIHKDLLIHGNRNIALTELPEPVWRNAIVCVSPNKAFNFGGLKSSYTVIPNEALRQRLENRLKRNAITSPNVFAVPALIAAYTESGDWLDRLIAYIEGNFACVEGYLARRLPAVRLTRPEASYLAWLDLRGLEMSESEIHAWLIDRAKVGVSFGDEFIADGEGFIRMNLGCPRGIIEEALQRMVGALHSFDR